HIQPLCGCAASFCMQTRHFMPGYSHSTPSGSAGEHHIKKRTLSYSDRCFDNRKATSLIVATASRQSQYPITSMFGQ
ncbi:MAG: hypothetical protein L6Q97_18250, partial [Thermoanaerobaculia bacterium]|nr:hypothetical protein [Thermoanaerobaculia bacterium]